MKARRVKGLDPGSSTADNFELVVQTRLAELWKLSAKALDPRHVVELHDLRIAAKRLRYVLEIAAEPCFGPYAVTAARRLRRLQDVIGEIHDCDVQLPRVVALQDELRAADIAQARSRAADGADLDPAQAAGLRHAAHYRGLEALRAYLTARRELLFEHFTEQWNALERDGFRARLLFAAGERPQVLTPAPPAAGPQAAAEPQAAEEPERSAEPEPAAAEAEVEAEAEVDVEPAVIDAPRDGPPASVTPLSLPADPPVAGSAAP